MGSLFNSVDRDTVQALFIGKLTWVRPVFPLPLWSESWDVGLTSSVDKTPLQENSLTSGVFGNTSGKGGYQRESRASFIFASNSTECPGSVMCHPRSLLCLQGSLLTSS